MIHGQWLEVIWGRKRERILGCIVNHISFSISWLCLLLSCFLHPNWFIYINSYVLPIHSQQTLLQGVVTYMSPVETFATTIKFFDRQKVCLIAFWGSWSLDFQGSKVTLLPCILDCWFLAVWRSSWSLDRPRQKGLWSLDSILIPVAQDIKWLALVLCDKFYACHQKYCHHVCLDSWTYWIQLSDYARTTSHFRS